MTRHTGEVTLRALLIQRAARLQDRPAFTCAPWPTLSYAQLRNRAEGVGLGLLANGVPEATFAAGHGPWDWMAELAAATAGVRWDPAAAPLDPAVLGGPRFNDEHGRGPLHDREDAVDEATPFTATLTHGECLRRLARLNGALGWDHETVMTLPLEAWGTPVLRGALWSALYAGAHAVLAPRPEPPGRLARWLGATPPPAFDPAPFQALGL